MSGRNCAGAMIFKIVFVVFLLVSVAQCNVSLRQVSGSKVGCYSRGQTRHQGLQLTCAVLTTQSGGSVHEML